VPPEVSRTRDTVPMLSQKTLHDDPPYDVGNNIMPEIVWGVIFWLRPSGEAARLL